MLAYVFWHWPQPGADLARYTQSLRTFHSTLRTEPPAGFLSSAVFELPTLPFQSSDAPAEPPYFEDWYLVEDFAALGELNLGAISKIHRLSHDMVAGQAGGGTGGLYRLATGEAQPATMTTAAWFAKPADVRYETLFAQLGPLERAGDGALWQRQMVLGPAPEFCWWAQGQVALPDGLHGQDIPLKHVLLPPTP